MVDRVSTAFEKLTPREREILRLIAAHLQSKEIARALGLSPKTVEMHVLSARRRLSGMSRRDAALAFVAWEGGDYRPAAPSDVSPADQEIGYVDDRVAPDHVRDMAPAGSAPPGDLMAAFQELVAGPDNTPVVQRGWRHEMSNLQWLGLVLGITALIAMLLALTATGVHAFIMAIQRITGL